MKSKTFTLNSTFAALATVVTLLSGCGQSSPTPPPATTALPEKHFDITANDMMKFSTAMLTVKANQKVSITLKNIGQAPKIAMGHNLVLLDMNTDAKKFIEAGTTHAATDYIAPEMKTKVLAETKILGPDESDTITFTAPARVGQYDFLCTFPGHFATGMKGTLLVDPNQ